MASPGQILRTPRAELDHRIPADPVMSTVLPPDTNLYGSNSIGHTHNFGSSEMVRRKMSRFGHVVTGELAWVREKYVAGVSGGTP